MIGARARVGTTNAVALIASTLALHGQRVLALDADLEAGTLGAQFGLGPVPGLADVVAGRRTVREALHRTMGGVHVIAAGRASTPAPAPSPLERLRTITQIEQLAAEFDVMLVDAGSPTTALASLLAAWPQEIVLVCTPDTEACHGGADTLGALGALRPKASVSVLINRSRCAHDSRTAFVKLTRFTEPTLSLDLHYGGAIAQIEAAWGRRVPVGSPSIEEVVRSLRTRLPRQALSVDGTRVSLP